MKKAVSLILLLSIYLTASTLFAQDRLASTPSTPDSTKLYLVMTEDEKLAFIEQRANFVATLFVKAGNQPFEINKTAVRFIKSYVDHYAIRAGNKATRLWAEDTMMVLERGQKYAPVIAQAFENEDVPAGIGIYIAMIESENRTNLISPANCKGMFQLLPYTAEVYGTKNEEIWDAQKSARAAARYMKDRINEFGSDGFGVTLSKLSYTRSPKRVKRDFQDVMNNKKKDEAFWATLANPDKRKFDKWFFSESVHFIPKIYAAAIVGETPEAFGIQTQPLSKVAR